MAQTVCVFGTIQQVQIDRQHPSTGALIEGMGGQGVLPRENGSVAAHGMFAQSISVEFGHIVEIS